jgi:multidrug efflux pump subunit AcrA (membrane-fusion protein)
MGVSRVSRGRLSRLPRRLGAGLALVASALVLGACDEVPSNQRDNQPYTVEGPEDAAIKRIKMEDGTAALLPVELKTVRQEGGRKVVPHNAVIYNPDGGSFVYTKPKAETYIRAPIEIVRVDGNTAELSKGPRTGTTIVTTGSAELLATEYEILNQHP